MSAGWTKLAPIAGVLAVAVTLVWGPLLWAPFIYDDGLYLLNKPEITGPWPGVTGWLLTPMGGTGVYEPLNLLVHRWLWALAGDRPAPYRLASLVLHWANAALVFALLRRLLHDLRAAFALALLFAVFPPHAEVLAVSTFKKHLLVSFFGLLLWTFIQPRATRRWASGAAASLLALAVMTKESGLAIPLLGLILGAAQGRGFFARLKAEKAFWLAQLAVCGVFLAWRLSCLPIAGRPPLGGSWPAHAATSGKIFLWYFRQAALPWPLCPESDLAPVRSALSFEALAVAAGLAGFAAGLAWVWKRDRVAGAGLAWAMVALAPFINLVPSLNLSLVADRYLYLASVGILLALWRAAANWPRRGRFALAVVGVAWAALSARQASLYANPIDLWTCAATCAPANPRTHTALANELAQRGRRDAATAELERAVALSPDEFRPTSERLLADAYAAQGRLAEALALSEKLASRSPSTLAWSEVGVLRLRVGDREGAAAALQKALELNSRNGDALVALGQVRAAEGRAGDAESLWQEAAALYPFRARALTELGALYLRQRRLEGAGRAFRDALAADPFELSARRGLAELYALQGDRAAGLELFDDLLARIAGSRAALSAAKNGAEARALLDQTADDVRLSRERFASGRAP